MCAGVCVISSSSSSSSSFKFNLIFTFWMVHIKESLLLIEKNGSCSGGSGFPLSLSEYVRRHTTVY